MALRDPRYSAKLMLCLGTFTSCGARAFCSRRSPSTTLPRHVFRDSILDGRHAARAVGAFLARPAFPSRNRMAPCADQPGFSWCSSATDSTPGRFTTSRPTNRRCSTARGILDRGPGRVRPARPSAHPLGSARHADGIRGHRTHVHSERRHATHRACWRNAARSPPAARGRSAPCTTAASTPLELAHVHGHADVHGRPDAARRRHRDTAIPRVGRRTRPAWALFYLTFFSSCLAYTAYGWLSLNATPALIGTYGYVNPAIAAFLGWQFLDEHLSNLQLIGMVIIIAGSGHFDAARRQSHRSEDARRTEDAVSAEDAGRRGGLAGA
jgi:multidrug transporter EmrE-like cation transporter